MEKNLVHNILCLRKTSPAARKSLFRVIKHIIVEWNLSEIVKINITEMSFTFINGSTIMCSGLDDEEKIRSIFGLTKIFLEECTEFNIHDYRQCNLRLRGKMAVMFQLFLAFNPTSRLSWVHDEFFTKHDPKTLTHHSTYKDNRYLDDEYIENLEDLINQDKNYYDIYCLGKWGSASGLIYNNYEFISKWPKEIEGDIVYGLDFGYNHPTAVSRVAEYNKGFAIDNILHESELTNADLIKRLPSLIHSKAAYIYADGSRPEHIEEIKRAGWNIHPADRKPGSVKPRIDYCKRQRLYIMDTNVELKKELEGYTWKKDKDGNPLDEPVKYKDDGINSFEYPIYTHWANRKELFVYSINY